MNITRSVSLVLVLAAPAMGQSFNVDFGQPGAGPSATYGAAGLPGFWNSIEGEHTPFQDPQVIYDLKDLDGNPTAVTLYQFGGQELIDSVLLPPGNPTGDDAILLKDALVTHSINLESCLYFNGLQSGTYEVLIYAWMPNNPQVDAKTRVDNAPNVELVGGAWPGFQREGVTSAIHLVEVTSGFLGPHAGLPIGGDTVIGGPLNGIQLRRLCHANVPCDCVYGDVGGSGVADLDDLMCMTDSLSGLECEDVGFEALDISPCGGGDGAVNLYDRVSMLDALGGDAPCCN